MRIDPRTGGLLPTAGPSQRGAAPGAARFALDGGRAEASSAARSAAPLATLDAILALQVEEDPRERRRRAATRGRDILDALDGLKAGLLAGAVSGADLGRLTGALAKAQAVSSGDPALDGMMAAIELRARVELAKLGRE